MIKCKILLLKNKNLLSSVIFFYNIKISSELD